jgi:predicted NBD/HSP70 family sugar kinase
MAGYQTTTVRDLRRSNRSRALWQVFLDGPLTRQEIGAQAGLSPATVSNLVADLVTEGIIAEVGLEDSNGGRPRGLLEVDPRYGYVIGVDIGETAVLVELFDVRLRPLARHRLATDTAVLDPVDTMAHVAEGIRAVRAEAEVEAEAIVGVGVAVPGLVEHGLGEGRPAEHHESGAGAVVYGQSVGWDAVPVEAMLRELVGRPVLVDNGAKTLGQAEQWFGAARGSDNAIIVLLGTGVGTCVISDGEVYRGATSSAGEWGHTAVMVGGRLCRCGARGCLEAYVGAEAIAARYAELRGGGVAASPADLEGAVAALIAAESSDAVAADVLGEMVTYLGAGIANLVNLFNPERVVVGGWLGQALSDGLLERVSAAARAQALRLPFRSVSIVRAELGPDAVALGGATLPVARLLNGGATRAAASRRPAASPSLSPSPSPSPSPAT